MPRGKVGAVSAEWPLALPERLDRTRSEGGPAKKAGSNVKAVRKRCTAAVARLCCQYRDGQNGNPGEQANEEAGDHFTPREVIRLMANLIYTGEQDQELVADELATQVDEDRRSAGQARAVLLAAAGRRAFEPQAVRRHAAQDVGAAAAKRVALTGRGATVFGSKRFSQGAVSAGAPFSPLNQRL